MGAEKNYFTRSKRVGNPSAANPFAIREVTGGGWWVSGPVTLREARNFKDFFLTAEFLRFDTYFAYFSKA